MSVVLCTRFNKGILLASDPFVFDNDGELPLKHIDFSRFFSSERLGVALVSVGSRWVFAQFCQELDAQQTVAKEHLSRLADQWQGLSQSWKEQRQQDAMTQGDETLRPLSDSLLFLTMTSDINTIHLIDSDGNLHATSSFALAGSGSHLLRNYLETKRDTFSSRQSLQESISLVTACYRAARCDLYVIGYPSIIVVTETSIIDLAKQCAALWRHADQQYYDGLIELARNLDLQ